MRLTDLDRLETVMSETVMVIIRNPKMDTEATVMAVFDELGKIIHNAPIIDAVPVVHGEWKILAEQLYECSKCGAIVPTLDEIIPIEKHRYCRYCGAKMDGGKDDE